MRKKILVWMMTLTMIVTLVQPAFAASDTWKTEESPVDVQNLFLHITEKVIKAIDKSLVEQGTTEHQHVYKTSFFSNAYSFALGYDVALETPTYPEKDDQVLAFSSDIHNQSNQISVNRFENWIRVTQQNEGKFSFIGLCGDNGNGTGSASGDEYWALVAPVFSVLDASDVPYAVTSGNHEVEHGNYPNSSNATAKKLSRMEEVSPENANYHVYTFGVGEGGATNRSHMDRPLQPHPFGAGEKGSPNGYYILQSDIDVLEAYLKSVDPNEPVFILSHYPLHNTGGRTIHNNQNVIDVLNQYPNAIFIWGHNHTNAGNQEKHYDTIYTDAIDGQSIQFTYCAAGCMSDSEYGIGSNAVKGKGLIATVSKGEAPTVTLTYVDASGEEIIAPVTIDLENNT